MQPGRGRDHKDLRDNSNHNRPRRPDIEISRSDIAKLGTTKRRNSPIEQLCSSNSPDLSSSFIDRMKRPGKHSFSKLKGEIPIRRQTEKVEGKDPNKANLRKVSRMQIPEQIAVQLRAQKLAPNKQKFAKSFGTKRNVSPTSSINPHNSAPPLRLNVPTGKTGKSHPLGQGFATPALDKDLQFGV